MTAPAPAPSGLVRPFRVAISDSEIADLKQRLARTRWPDPETVPDWSQGVRVENAKSLVTYWEREYDWRRFESELNRFPQFLTTIDGLDIHFIYVKSKNPDAMPLILTHGWPGSIVEFLRLIGPLTDHLGRVVVDHRQGGLGRVRLRVVQDGDEVGVAGHHVGADGRAERHGPLATSRTWPARAIP
jgi:Epoxide hydrolase N terminus